jgi:hypothetical protein
METATPSSFWEKVKGELATTHIQLVIHLASRSTNRTPKPLGVPGGTMLPLSKKEMNNFYKDMYNFKRQKIFDIRLIQIDSFYVEVYSQKLDRRYRSFLYTDPLEPYLNSVDISGLFDKET